MSIEQIYLAMDPNRRAYDQRIAQIGRNVGQVPEFQSCLSDLWLEAMQRHDPRLWEYILLRDVAIRRDDGARPHLNAE